MLAQALEHVVEDQLAQELGLLARGKIDRLDLAADVALFVGQEEVVVAVAADQGLPSRRWRLASIWWRRASGRRRSGR